MSLLTLTQSSSGAITLNGVNGSLCDVLDWALPQKGWTIDYTGTNKRIYRAASGNRFPLRVVHDSAVSGAANFATVRGCESASGIDTVVDPFPTVALEPDNASRIITSSSANATARNYIIQVSETWFCIWIEAQASYWNPFFFGDLIPRRSGDNYCTAISVRGTSSTSTTDTSVIAYGQCAPFITMPSSPNWYFCRNVDGSVKSSVAVVCATASGLSGTLSANPQARAGYENAIEREKISLSCGGGSTTTITSLAIIRRGWIPNVWNPLHNGHGGLTSTNTFTDTTYNASALFRVMPFGTAASSGFSIIEETDTWSAPNG